MQPKTTTHSYRTYEAKKASLKLEEVLAKLSNKQQTTVEVLKYKPPVYAHSDINNAREVLARLMNRSAKPGIASIERVSKEVDI